MTFPTRFRLAAALAVAPLAFGAAACSSDDDADSSATSTTQAAAPADTAAPTTDDAAEALDIVDTAVEAGQFTTLAQLLTDAGLVETLKGEGPFTVFAPTDEAFAKLDPATLEAVQNDPALLEQVLTNHVIAGEVMAADVEPGEVEMVSGDTVTITVADGKVMVNDATVVTTDIVASNGVIHVIDTVLVPAS